MFGVATCRSFGLFDIFYIDSFTFIQHIHPSPFASKLNGKNLPVVPSRDYSGLPNRKPTHFQIELRYTLCELYAAS
jgi:hypothetical protein